MKIEVYTRNNCDYCARLKVELFFRELDWTEYNLEKGDFTAKALKDRLGVPEDQRITMPQVFIDDKSIGGYDDFMKLDIGLLTKGANSVTS